MSADEDEPAQPWILTGMSGAGKLTALRALEAAGASCLDNLPVPLLGDFLAMTSTETRVAVIDGRRGSELGGIEGIAGARVLFLDAVDAVLVRRLADSRRPHPCAAAGSGRAAVAAERALIAPLRAAADIVIDTGSLAEVELGDRVIDIVLPQDRRSAALRCTVSSFGFKYGAQSEADWVIDSRVLPNPFWVAELRPLTGLDERVRAFLLEQPQTGELLERSIQLLGWGLERSRDRGAAAAHVAVGCTGGRHRSVVVAIELAARLGGPGITVEVRHRDVDRPDPR